MGRVCVCGSVGSVHFDRLTLCYQTASSLFRVDSAVLIAPEETDLVRRRAKGRCLRWSCKPAHFASPFGCAWLRLSCSIVGPPACRDAQSRVAVDLASHETSILLRLGCTRRMSYILASGTSARIIRTEKGTRR
ncbi:hypothetical protein IF2G_04403 [Cordyceps javanica]|nr:hypothetical protein IF2G_04403 [Cordyceps javanica]